MEQIFLCQKIFCIYKCKRNRKLYMLDRNKGRQTVYKPAQIEEEMQTEIKTNRQTMGDIQVGMTDNTDCQQTREETRNRESLT